MAGIYLAPNPSSIKNQWVSVSAGSTVGAASQWDSLVLLFARWCSNRPLAVWFRPCSIQEKMRPMKSFSHAFVRMILCMFIVPPCNLWSLLSQLLKTRIKLIGGTYTPQEVFLSSYQLAPSVNLMPHGCTVVATPTGRSICLFLARDYVQFVCSPFDFALN
jgi:hypothetical protein